MDCKLKMVIDEMFYKTIEIILQSRVTLVHSNIFKSRFNIQIEEIKQIRDLDINSNFIKLIISYNQTPIEQWIIQFNKSYKTITIDIDDLKKLYNNISILLRCLYIHVKLYPAFKFKGELSYNILHTDSNDFINMSNPNKYSFTPIDSIFGIISISIIYEINMQSLSERPMDVIIIDCILKDNYDNMNLPPFYIIKKEKEMDIYNFYNLLSNAPPLTIQNNTISLKDLLNELDKFKRNIIKESIE